MKKVTLLIPLFLILAFIGMAYYDKWYHDKLEKSPQMYVYETYMGPANPVFIINDLNYKKELIAYYEYAEKNNEYSSFNFPLKTLSPVYPVYVVGYTEDSLLASIVCLEDRGPHLGNYTEGYVYYKTLHSLLPPQNNTPRKGLDDYFKKHPNE